MKKNIRRIILGASLLAITTLTGCASCSRSMKSFQSDISGGLHRKITVYDYNGREIKSWEGKFDVSNSENEVYFDDADGKRVIIHGGIVINEEE